METDERLLPIPEVKDSPNPQGLQPTNQEYPANYSPFYDEDSFSEKRSIREYFNVVYKRLPYILALTILATAAAAFYMYRQPSIYLAVTTMIIEPRKPKPQSTQAVNINFGNNQNYYNTQLKLLKNPELMQDVVVRLGLHNNTNLMDGGRKGVLGTLKSIFSGSEQTQTEANSLPIVSAEDSDELTGIEQANLTPKEKRRVELYAGKLLGGLVVDQTPRTNLVNLSVTNVNPDLAAKVADAVANIFIEQDTNRETSGAKKAYDELSKSIADLKITIAGQEQRFIGDMRATGLPLGDGKVNDLSADELGILGKQRLEAIDERRRIEVQYNAALRADSAYGLLDGSGNQVASELRSRNEERNAKLDDEIRGFDKQIQIAEAELAKLRVKYKDEFKPVLVKIAEIKQLKESRNRIEKSRRTKIEQDKRRSEKAVQSDIVKSLRAKLGAARKRENQLDAAYARSITSANLKGVAETKLTTQKREIETNRTLLDKYIQQQKERELAIQSSRPDNIKISANAITPVSPIGPNRNRNIMIAFLVSLVGGIGLSFLLDYLDDSIKTSDDVGRNLGLPTLALIPHHNTIEKKTRKMLAIGEGDGGVSSTAMVALEDNRSAMAEAYRHLRTSLLFSSAGKPPETILVTSSQPSEGKTTTAINTAITLARSGAEVVLIDCDLRRPRLHSHFNMENSHGLTNYLSGERDTDNLLKPLPSLQNLKVITSGPIPPNPAELLSSNEMKHLLQFLKGNFKHVVIDSPPAISFTDAAILATLVDGVVLVAMAGKSSVHLMRRFKQRLANIGARIYGVVLNGIKPNSIEYGYYGYGYTYYNVDEDDSTPVMEDDADNLLEDQFIDDDYEEVDSDEQLNS